MAIKARAAQDFVPIKEVRDGVIILKNDELRAIMLVNSINLSLKSIEEQKATMLQFQNFLNTLDFSIQISIESRRLDIRPYLLLLEGKMKLQTEPLLKLQTREYMDFIKNFNETANIMTKSFFITVPYAHTFIKTDTSIFSKFFSTKNKKEAQIEKQMAFEEKRSQLEQRVSVIEQGLARCGIKSAQLGTEEIVEVFYKVFNPGELEGKIQLEQEPNQ